MVSLFTALNPLRALCILDSVFSLAWNAGLALVQLQMHQLDP